MIAERNPQIGKAVVKLRRLSADEQTRDLFERREKARRDMESRERWAKQEGRQEGRQEERFDIANNLLGMKLPVDQVAAATGLSRNEVEALRQ